MPEVEDYKLQQQSPRYGIYRCDHLQLTRTFHLAVTIEVFCYVLHLLCRKERQLFQVFTRSVVDIYLVIVEVL